MSKMCKVGKRTPALYKSVVRTPDETINQTCTNQSGRNIVITGGTRGLGRIQAEYALKCGANHVTITGRSKEKGGTPSDGINTQESLRAKYGNDRITYIQSDVRSDKDTHSLFDPDKRQAAGLPREVHAASLNAGIFGEAGPDRVLESLPVKSFESVMNTNCTGPFRGIKEFAKAAGKTQVHNPSLLLIKSIYGSGGSAFSNAGYQASKFCVDGLVKQAAIEFAQEDPERGTPRITVNSISPGFAKTPLTKGWWDNPIIDEIVAYSHPQGRWVNPYDIGEVSQFLLNAPRSMTGVDIFVDNGVSSASVPTVKDSEYIRSMSDEPCCGKSK